MTFKLDHMCSVVHDMDTTINFYTNILGGQVADYQILKDEKCVYIQVIDQLIKFVEPKTHDSSINYGLKNLAFTTDNIDEAYKFLINLGYEFHVNPQLSPSGNGKNAFFKDPNGVIVELLERDRTIHRQPIHSDVVCCFDHYAVTSHDLKLAHKLYHNHLELENLAHFVIGDNIREIMYLNHGTATLEIVQSDVYKKNDNPHSHLAFRVEDIEKTCKILTENGVKMPEEGPKIAGIQTGLTISFPDPEGVRIELLARCDLRDLEKNGITIETLPTMRPF